MKSDSLETAAETEIEAGAPAPDAGDTLTVVGENALRLLAGFPSVPTALRIRVGEVSIEAEWATALAPTWTSAPATNGATNGAASNGAAPAPSLPTDPATNGSGPAPSAPADPGTRSVTATMVGVFYRAPEPGAPPFVEVGTRLKPGDQVGILEAMKLMVPVHAEEAGTVSEILKANGEGVEYGEPLIAYTVD